MICSLRQIQEKAIEQNPEIYVVFVDFRKKTFGTVDRPMLWNVLELFECLENLIEVIKQLHDGAKRRVVVGLSDSEAIEVGHSTKQDCVLALTLITLFLTFVLTLLHQEICGVYTHTRSDERFFNLASQLKPK